MAPLSLCFFYFRLELVSVVLRRAQQVLATPFTTRHDWEIWKFTTENSGLHRAERDLTNEWLINEKLLHCPFSAVSQPNWTELRAHVDTIKHLIACGWAIITEVSWGKTYSTSCESWLHVYHDCVYFCKIKYLSAGKSFYLYRHAEISPSGFQLKNRLYVSMWSISRKVLRLFVFVLSNHAEFLQF